MKDISHGRNAHFNCFTRMSLALSQYNFSTPEIRVLMRHVLGHAPSSRTIKRVARIAGTKLTRGRPRSTPRIHKNDLNRLIRVTSAGLEDADGNALILFQRIQLEFGLTPRQYCEWLAKFVRRRKYMMRRCLLCGELFPSLDSGDRNCDQCNLNRRRLLKEEGQSAFGAFANGG